MTLAFVLVPDIDWIDLQLLRALVRAGHDPIYSLCIWAIYNKPSVVEHKVMLYWCLAQPVDVLVQFGFTLMIKGFCSNIQSATQRSLGATMDHVYT
jgi:hypothetical protein